MGTGMWRETVIVGRDWAGLASLATVCLELGALALGVRAVGSAHTALLCAGRVLLLGRNQGPQTRHQRHVLCLQEQIRSCLECLRGAKRGAAGPEMPLGAGE